MLACGAKHAGLHNGGVWLQGLQSSIAWRRSRHGALGGDCAQEKLRAAVAVEDAMGYMEPERQFAPVRLCLGAVLLHAGKPGDALQARLAPCVAELCCACWW